MRLHRRLPPFHVKHRGHRGQNAKAEHSCGLQAEWVPGTNRGQIGDRPGTLLDGESNLFITSLSIAPASSLPRPFTHFAGIRRKGFPLVPSIGARDFRQWLSPAAASAVHRSGRPSVATTGRT